jgi:hypothetical protein
MAVIGRTIFSLALLVPCLMIKGQQNQHLFHMHYLGESNFLNPAVQSDCKWFVGLPIVSSIHLNYANSIFTYHQLVNNTSDSTYFLNIDRAVNHAGRRSLIGSEFHTTLLALGYNYEEYYFSFSIIEKNNIPVTVSQDMLTLVWNGNASFEGEEANLKGTSSYATHYREYALGVSKENDLGNSIGIKAKLLFGKLNAAVPKMDVGLYTEETTFDLALDADIRMNISGPFNIRVTGGAGANFLGNVDISLEEGVSVSEIMLNRKNWGLAFDAGFIYHYNGRATISGSILDIGFIRWRSSMSNLSAQNQYVYRGALVDGGNIDQSILDSLDYTITNEPYFTLLPTKIYLGAEYVINEKLAGRGLVSTTIYRTKFTPALTLSLDYNPFGNFHIVGGYSLFYRSFNNFGLGFSIGRGPVQVYAVSDNILGLIRPLDTRNLNLRFGLNINLGCETKEPKPKSYSTGRKVCSVYDKANERNKRKAKWKRQ